MASPLTKELLQSELQLNAANRDLSMTTETKIPKGEAMAKGKGKATGNDDAEEKRTRVVRVPDDVGEMLEAIAQHGLNGWRSVPVVLRDPNCPLKDWLLPLYQRVLKEKAEILEKAKQS